MKLVIKVTICAYLSSFKPVEVTFRFGGHLPKTYTGCLCSIPSSNNRVGFFDLDQSDPMDVILGDNELIEAAMQKSPQRIRNIAITKPIPSDLPRILMMNGITFVQSSKKILISERLSQNASLTVMKVTRMMMKKQ